VSLDTVSERSPASRLSAELAAVAVLSLVALWAGYRWLAVVRSPVTAGRWLVPTGVVLSYTLWFCWRHRRTNRGPAGTTLGSLGVANAVTLARGGLYAGVAGFLVVGPSAAVAWLPAAGYAGGAALDAVDGALARRIGTETTLGEKLDMAVDTTGFLVAPLVAVVWGRLPVWYLSLSAARYCYRLGCLVHRRRGGTVRSLPRSRLRRPLAGIQMAFIAVALVPVVPTGPLAVAAAAVLAPSLAVFCRDFLAVTGRLETKQS
jgi:CDP-diacylglycerol--glycerol-3-phosphate 3-phosphatidyltransferase